MIGPAAYDRAIRQLSVCLGVLSAVLVALVARSVIDGPTLTAVLAEALIAVLLLASRALWRYVRPLEAHASALGTATPAAGREKRVVVADLHESNVPRELEVVMTDRPKQPPPGAPDFISGRTRAGDTGRLRRWSVATLIARSRARAEDAAPESAHRTATRGQVKQ
jgi:hypothetical protein